MRAMDRRGPFLPIGHVNEEEKETTMQCLKHVPAVEAHTKIVEGELAPGIWVRPLPGIGVQVFGVDNVGRSKEGLRELGLSLMRLSEFM